MFYSKSKNTWFDPAFRADYEAAGTWPVDGVEYPRELFEQTVANRPTDKVMVPDANGCPTLIDRPAPTAAEQQAQANTEARTYLAATDWYVIRMLEGGPAIPDDVADARAAARLAVVE